MGGQSGGYLSARGWRILVGLGLVVAGCAAQEVDPSPRHLLLITLDTTRIEMLGSYGGPGRTPHLDALAESSLRFEQAITTAPYTGPSHASILTGLEPPRHGLRDYLEQALPQGVDTLAEILKSQGFETGAFVSAYVLDPRYGLDQGFDVYSSPKSSPEQEQAGTGPFVRPGRETVDEAIAWLKGRSADRPFFLWLHLYDAHARPVGPGRFRYLPPPNYRNPLPEGVRPNTPEAIRQRYYEQAGYLDELVEDVLRVTRELGFYQRMIVAIAADHGEMLGEYGRPLIAHSTHLVDQTVRVPLILRIPGHGKGVRSEQVSVVDLLPTLLEGLDLPVPSGLDGSSLLRESAEPRAAYSETLYERYPVRAGEGEELASLRLDGWKLVTGRRGEALYDLRRDPAELRDVSSENPEQMAKLMRLLEERRGRWSGNAPSEPLKLSEEEERSQLGRLRALGYVE